MADQDEQNAAGGHHRLLTRIKENDPDITELNIQTICYSLGDPEQDPISPSLQRGERPHWWGMEPPVAFEEADGDYRNSEC
jgi:hypothetical protein